MADELPPDLRAAAEMIGVRDVDSAWLKFCGKYDGHIKRVASEWQSFAASWRANEQSAAARGRRGGVKVQPAGPSRSWKVGGGDGT
jgi:hypothetical protein